MANQVIPLSLANTFGNWLVTTNQVLAETNDLGANNYTKNTGSFIINSTGTGLQVANDAIIQGSFQVIGTGSSAIVQNNLTVSGQIRAANTTTNNSGALGLRVDGTANIANLNITGAGVDGAGFALIVANNANIRGFAQANTANVGTLSAVTRVIGLTITANGQLNAGSANVVGQLNAGSANVVGHIIGQTITANGQLNAGSANVVGHIIGQTITANSQLNGGSLNIQNSGLINAGLVINERLNVGSVSANSYVNTAVIYVSDSINAKSIFANSSIETHDALVNNDLTVIGDFTITGQTIYDSDTLNLRGASPITGTAKATFGVNRQAGLPTFTPNAQIQFDNSDGLWKIRDIANTSTTAAPNTYYEIVTTKFTANTTMAGLVRLSNSNTSSSITEALSLAGARNLDLYITDTAAGANSVINTRISANVATINGSITSNTNSTLSTLRGEITGNVSTINGSITSNTSTLRGEITANAASANSVINTRISANVATINGSITSNTNSTLSTLRGEITGNVSTLNSSITTVNNRAQAAFDTANNAPTKTGGGASGNWAINITGTAGSVAWGNVTSKPFNYSGQSGQPTWLWGTNNGVDYYVWNPSNFSVGSATTASNVTSISNAVGASYTWTAYQLFTGNGNTASATSTGINVYSTGGNGAVMAFHRAGSFAVNMGLDSDNVFRIGGWSASANRLQMDMSGNLTMAGNVTGSSDERLKTNWRPLSQNFIELLSKVKVGVYDRIDNNNMTQVGVSAQSLQAVMPEAVSADANGILSVAYGNAALAAAIKLAEKVIELEKRLAAIEGKH